MKSETKFLNCKINLSKKVFQPRIETAFWVGKALKEIKQKAHCSHTATNKKPTVHTQQKTKVLDIFAGSGCIGITILRNIKNSIVDFVDVSKEAIEQIKINLRLNKIPKNKYRTIRSNLFEKLKGERYDFIFANPPYIPDYRKNPSAKLRAILRNRVQKSVLKYEPKSALFGGSDGLYYIQKFLKQVKNHLSEKGKIFMEFDPPQKNEIANLLKKNKYKEYKFHNDQHGRWRWVNFG